MNFLAEYFSEVQQVCAAFIPFCSTCTDSLNVLVSEHQKHTQTTEARSFLIPGNIALFIGQHCFSILLFCGSSSVNTKMRFTCYWHQEAAESGSGSTKNATSE